MTDENALTENESLKTLLLNLITGNDGDDSRGVGPYEGTVDSPSEDEDGAELEGVLHDLDEGRTVIFGKSDDLEETTARLNDLGKSFGSRFQQTGDMDDISESIRCLQYSVLLTPVGHPQLPHRLNNLGSSFCCRFQHIEDIADITEAIRHQQHAVKITPEGHEDCPAFLDNLGISFGSRFSCTGEMDDISEAIRHQQKAVQLTPEGHAELPEWLDDLGVSLYNRFECTGNMDDIAKAIQYQQQAVRLTSDGHAALPRLLSNLGNSLWGRFEHTGDMADVAEAIQLQRRAVQLTQDGHPELPCRLNSIGTSLSSRFERTGDLNEISEAIRYQQQAVHMTQNGDAALPRWLNNLGLSFWRRFQHTEDMVDISEAIQHHQHAVRLTPDEHADMPCRLDNLGLSFGSRFERTGDVDDISEAIKHQQRAVELARDGHAELPGYLDNLGNSLTKRFERTENMEDISAAIRHQQQAVELMMESEHPHPELPGRLNNLAISHAICFDSTGDMDDILQSIRLLQCAIQLTPDGHVDLPIWYTSLGSSFLHHFESTGEDGSLQSAVSNYRLSATSPSCPPSLRLAAAKQWASFSQPSFSPPSDLIDAHSCIIHLLPVISGLGSTVQRRHANLVDASQLSLAAAAAALSVGQPDKALEWLVEGRCIVWNQIHQLRTPVDELRSYDSALADRLSTLSKELENAGLRSDSRGIRTDLSMNDKMSLEDEARMHIKHAKDWEQLLETIRSIPRFKDFLQPRNCADIMSGLPEEGPVIIINMHTNRCDALALIAGAHNPIHIPLKLSFQEAERLANGLRCHLQSFGIRLSRLGLPLDAGDSPHPVDFPTVLKTLWSEVVSPILQALSFSIPDSDAKLPRIWWCPTGPLAFLPIHAAGIYHQGKGVPGSCLSEFAVSSYIPTIHVLEAYNSVGHGSDAPTGLLMICQPKTPGKDEIPFVRDEIDNIEKQLGMRRIPYSTLIDESATVGQVLRSMEDFSGIHLACHASQDIGTSLKSSIHLHDGPLELTKIMKTNLRNADFAFLSACQTSKGDAKLPDEAVHLAAGMLAAGYRSVVGTMWAMIDKHGPDLAELFYNKMLRVSTNEGTPKIDGRRAARALHDATKHLQEKYSSDSYLAWVPYIHIGI